MFCVDRINDLRQAGWNLPQDTLQNDEIKKWFQSHAKLSMEDANSYQKSATELAKGTLWTGGGTIVLSALSPIALPIFIVGGLITTGFGFGSLSRTVQKNELLEKYRIFKRTEQIWTDAKKDAVYLGHLKNDIQTQYQELQGSSDTNLPQVVKKTREKWNSFLSKRHITVGTKRKTKLLRRKGKNIVNSLQELDVAIKDKTWSSTKIREKKGKMLEILQSCVQKGNCFDTLIQEQETSAAHALYGAVLAEKLLL